MLLVSRLNAFAYFYCLFFLCVKSIVCSRYKYLIKLIKMWNDKVILLIFTFIVVFKKKTVCLIILSILNTDKTNWQSSLVSNIFVNTAIDQHPKARRIIQKVKLSRFTIETCVIIDSLVYGLFNIIYVFVVLKIKSSINLNVSRLKVTIK